jgi:hypothetical protein
MSSVDPLAVSFGGIVFTFPVFESDFLSFFDFYRFIFALECYFFTQ